MSMGRSSYRNPAVVVSALFIVMLGLALLGPAGSSLAEDLPPTIVVDINDGYRSHTEDVSFDSKHVTVIGTVDVDRHYVKPETIDLSVEGTDWGWTITPNTFDITTLKKSIDFTAVATIPIMFAEGTYTGQVVATWTDSIGENSIDSSDDFDVIIDNNPFYITANPIYVLMEPGQTRQVSVTIEDNSPRGMTYLCQVGKVTSPDKPGWLDRALFWLDINTLHLSPGASESLTLEIVIPQDVSPGVLDVPLVVSIEDHPEHTQQMNIPVNVQGVPIAPPGGGGGGGEDGIAIDPVLIFWISIAAIAIGLVGFLGFTEVGLLAVFWTLLLPLFTRLRRKEVLNQFTRGEIFGFVTANPGVHLTAIKENLGLANGVLAYHLKVLVREEFLVVRREGGFKRFYPRDMKVPRKRVHFTRLQLDIVEKLSLHPGLTQAALARMLGESKQVINYNISVLIAAEVVRVEREGGKTLCYVTDGSSVKPQMAELVEEEEAEDAEPTGGFPLEMKM